MQNGNNALRVGDYNRRMIMEVIRLEEGTNRARIASSTGLSGQAVSKIVGHLVREALVTEIGKGASIAQGGRPPIGLRINPEAGYAVGIHIDRDEVRFVVLDLEGQVVARDRCSISDKTTPQMVMELAADSIERLLQDAGVVTEKVLGLGVACPGPLDHATGLVYELPGMPGWDNLQLKDGMEDMVGYPVIVDNDAIAAAVGERWSGTAQTERNFAFIYIGWGMGSGLFIDNRVYRGSTSTAGEIGHLPLVPDGPECSCGNRGCIHLYCRPNAIVSAIEQRLKKGEPSSLKTTFDAKPGNLDFSEVGQAVLAGDRLAIEEVERSARILARALVGLTNILDLDLIVLGGSAFRDLSHLYEKEIGQALGERLLYQDRRNLRLEISLTGEDAGAVGAASLILHAAYGPSLAGLGSLSLEAP